MRAGKRINHKMEDEAVYMRLSCYLRRRYHLSSIILDKG